MSIETSSVSLKLVIDAQGERVLFAEAGKDFVDFLFCILSLPVAKLISLVGPQATVGSLGKLYGGLENLGDSYIQSNRDKNDVLKPVCLAGPGGVSNSIPLLGISPHPKKTIYGCNYCGCSNSFADDPSAVCPRCSRSMTTVYQYVGTPSKVQRAEGGLVKGIVTYMVMDDLDVKPMSASLFTALLKTSDIKDVAVLEEKEVILGMNEAVKLLKASVETDRVLTRAFLDGGGGVAVAAPGGAAAAESKEEEGDSDHDLGFSLFD